MSHLAAEVHLMIKKLLWCKGVDGKKNGNHHGSYNFTGNLVLTTELKT